MREGTTPGPKSKSISEASYESGHHSKDEKWLGVGNGLRMKLSPRTKSLGNGDDIKSTDFRVRKIWD